MKIQDLNKYLDSYVEVKLKDTIKPIPGMLMRKLELGHSKRYTYYVRNGSKVEKFFAIDVDTVVAL